MLPLNLAERWSAASRTFKVIALVGGAITAASGAIAGVPVAWRTLGLPEFATKYYVTIQLKELNDKTDKIYEFQRTDRIERMEETAEQLDTKIKELTVKLPEIKDPLGVTVAKDLIDELDRKKRRLDAKLIELKKEH